jgi:hypothetical protein
LLGSTEKTSTIPPANNNLIKNRSCTSHRKEHRKATVPHVIDIYFPKDFTSKQAYSLRTMQED